MVTRELAPGHATIAIILNLDLDIGVTNFHHLPKECQRFKYLPVETVSVY